MGKSGCIIGKKLLFLGKISCNSEKSGCIPVAKVVVFGQSGCCFQAKAVVIGKKSLYSGKSGCIQAQGGCNPYKSGCVRVKLWLY